MVTRFKYQANFADGKVMSLLLGEKFSNYYKNQHHGNPDSDKPQLLIPVPLHRHRLAQRGFNQALEIARIVAAVTNIDVNRSLIIRQQNTPSQSQLSANDRAANVEQAFELNPRFTSSLPHHVAIIDDVVTTASTCNAIAALLKESGVNRVDVWALGRARLA
jgi:ComF family protein